MLPSTGYFKGINCPFYDSGLCERPYCHFRHVKRESQSSANDGIESGAILQKLVSAAVQKVLQQTEASVTIAPTQPSSSNIVVDSNKTSIVQTTSKVTYNPTPISELNKINSTETENNEDSNEQRKRHIPVPYTPRKPTSVPIRRPVETNGSSKPFIYIPPPLKYTPGSTENVQCDTYTPPGVIESSEKYFPGTEQELPAYTPDDTAQNNLMKRNYVPSDKSVSKKKILEYKPSKVTPKIDSPSVKYQPTPRSLAPCFSSDEDEPDIKKRKLSSDLNGLDDLGAEFDILDQILDEETTEKDSKNETKKDIKNDALKHSKDITKVSRHSESKTDKRYKQKNCSNTDTKLDKNIKDSNNSNDNIKSDKDSRGFVDNSKIDKVSDKKERSKSHKTKSHKKERSKPNEKEKEGKKRDYKTLNHRSSGKEKDKHKDKKENNNKHSGDKKNCSSTKSSDKVSDSLKTSSKSDFHLDITNSKNHKKRQRHRSSKDSTERHKGKHKEINNLSNNESLDDNICEIEKETYLSESDEETIALECKKIFEEYVPTVKSTSLEDMMHMEDPVEDEYIPTKKRISRTNDKNIKVIPKAPVKTDYKACAAQTMAERLAKVKEYHSSRNPQKPLNNDITNVKVELPKTTLGISNSGNTKVRIAHVPYASTLLYAKKTITPSPNITRSSASTSMAINSTAIQTVKKGSHRVAHMPNEKFIDRPGVLEPLASKIPANIRSTYLNMMIDECLKLYITTTDAYARAQHEELATSKKCSTVQIYKNSAVLAVSRLRKELQECNGIKKSGSECFTLQKVPENMSGKTNNYGSWSIESKNRKVFENAQEFTGTKLYKNIQKWILTEEQLQENGFPRPHTSEAKGRAIIYGQNRQKPPKGYLRTCCRCKKEYMVDKKGFPGIKEECIYHPNNKYRVRGEVRYQCCSQDGTSDGCCIAPNHVYEYVDYDNLKGYVKTLPPESVMDDYGVYSLDCEMSYTTHGLDLTRVTVINAACKVVYETLIKPLHPIIDYNTRFSGITEEQMTEVKTTLLDVQATLLTMFNSKTILIGHSLESDFKALKLIHDTVIDTSVLFPHKMGPPYKRALRNLSSEYLKKIIQNSVEGHNSAEDATVCMELLHFKLKEDLKTR